MTDKEFDEFVKASKMSQRQKKEIVDILRKLIKKVEKEERITEEGIALRVAIAIINAHA